MKFKQLIETVDPNSILVELIKEFDQSESNVIGHLDVLESLKHMEPEENDMVLLVERFEVEDFGLCVSGWDKTYNKDHKDDHPDFDENKPSDIEWSEQKHTYAIEFVRWEKWLDMECDQECLDKIGADKFVAACLWEMTFIGYDQEEIQGEKDKLNESVESIERGEGIEFESADDLLNYINKEIADDEIL